jgi:hypothetical protein
MGKRAKKKQSQADQIEKPKDSKGAEKPGEEAVIGVYTHVIVLKDELADSSGKFYHWNVNCPELCEKGEEEFLILLEAEARRQGFIECPRCQCSEFESVEIILNLEE